MYDATLYSSAIFASVMGRRKWEVLHDDRAMRGHRLRYASAAALLAIGRRRGDARGTPILPLGPLAAIAVVRMDPAYYKARTARMVRPAKWTPMSVPPKRHGRKASPRLRYNKVAQRLVTVSSVPCSSVTT